MKQRAIILSIPHSGTHFCCWLLKILGVDYRFNHFDKGGMPSIREYLPVLPKEVQVVVPWRPYADTVASWKARDGNMKTLDYNLNEFTTWYPRLFSPINVPIGPQVRVEERHAVVLRLAWIFGIDTANIKMRSELTELLETWGPVGSQFRNDNITTERNSLTTRNVLKFNHTQTEEWLFGVEEKK